MKILAIVSMKGGAGKSTLAASFAVAALLDGRRVGLIDTDPQASLVKWGKRRQEPAPTVTPADAENLPAALADMARRRADIVIIDTPPHTRVAVTTAAEHASGIVIPLRPYPHDLDAITETVAVARGMGKPAVLIINAAPVRAQASALARERLARLGIPVVPHDLHDRIAHPYAAGAGQTAQEYEPNGKAAGELAAAWAFVTATLAL